MFATPLDNRCSKKNDKPWSNIWIDSSFGLVLVDQACLYLVGGTGAGEVNFTCGKPVLVRLLSPGGEKQYQLKGPSTLTLSETKLPAPEGPLLAVPQANQPGNYAVTGEEGATVAAFSLNVAVEQSNLERVPAAEIEAALGPESLIPPDQWPRLQDAVKGGRAGTVELLPWLLMAVLLVLAIESVLANKFYRREPRQPEAAAARPPADHFASAPPVTIRGQPSTPAGLPGR